MNTAIDSKTRVDSDFVFTTEASIILHKSTATVKDYERRGILPAIRTQNGTRLFKRDDVERLAQQLRSGKVLR